MRFIDTVKELLLVYAALVLLCAGLYAYFESTTYINGVWWACVTALTVGYGDMFPATTGGRIVAVALMHATVLFILPLLIGNICSLCIRNRVLANNFAPTTVMPGLVPGIQVFRTTRSQSGHSWMAGTSPAMTMGIGASRTNGSGKPERVSAGWRRYGRRR